MKRRTILSVAALGAIALSGAVLFNSGESVLNGANDNVQEHLNVMFVPDLSNRVREEKPITDIEIFERLYNDIETNFIHADGKQAFQYDKYRFTLTNSKLIQDYNFPKEGVEIDLARFDFRQKERIDYLKNRVEHGINKDVSKMLETTKRVYSSALQRNGNMGTDIWSFFNKLSATDIMEPGSLPALKKGVLREYRNVIVLLTDGYLELGDGKDKLEKGSRSLTQGMINEFRKDFLKNANGRDLAKFFTDEGYGIKPLDNQLLAHTEIVVLEINDRSADQAGNTGDISDETIIKLFWNEWFKRSGVKAWKLESKVSSLSKLDAIIKEVIEKKYDSK